MRPRLLFSQRVVLIVALGFALYVVGLWLTNLDTHPFTGWAAYAPLSNSTFYPYAQGLHPWVRVVIWLLLTIVWTITSLSLLRPTGAPRDDTTSGTTP
jgi:hypothetical protein